jgi:hypothetical protein
MGKVCHYAFPSQQFEYYAPRLGGQSEMARCKLIDLTTPAIGTLRIVLRKRGTLGRHVIRLIIARLQRVPVEYVVERHLAEACARWMIASSSGGTGMRLNGLTLEPPVFPYGTSPIGVKAAAPAMRRT